MTIARRFTDDFNVIRPTLGSDAGGAEIVESTTTPIIGRCYIEELGVEEVAQLSAIEIVASKRMYCGPEHAIVNTDQVRVSSGEHTGTYEIRKIDRFRIGKNQHLEILLYNAE